MLSATLIISKLSNECNHFQIIMGAPQNVAAPYICIRLLEIEEMLS